jgi:hypothetical protein
VPRPTPLTQQGHDTYLFIFTYYIFALIYLHVYIFISKMLISCILHSFSHTFWRSSIRFHNLPCSYGLQKRVFWFRNSPSSRLLCKSALKWFKDYPLQLVELFESYRNLSLHCECAAGCQHLLIRPPITFDQRRESFKGRQPRSLYLALFEE